jgi:hypothetical protein
MHEPPVVNLPTAELEIEVMLSVSFFDALRGGASGLRNCFWSTQQETHKAREQTLREDFAAELQSSWFHFGFSPVLIEHHFPTVWMQNGQSCGI